MSETLVSIYVDKISTLLTLVRFKLDAIIFNNNKCLPIMIIRSTIILIMPQWMARFKVSNMQLV